AHPSVRIKGTEQIYGPVLCQDDKCSARAKGSHMHCPFCSVTEAYQDPVILQAHYRVKHVDKGIDFAGLKILRCCNHCEIVGTIKGEKKFKGAHWHCYRCRNGFNRRDEAIKHYKTHFRNPHTTFQIQVTQEVNNRQYYEQSAEAHPKAYGGLAVGTVNGDGCTLGSMLAQTVINTSTSAETLLTQAPKTGESLDQSLLLEKQLLELHQQNQALQQEKDLMEKKLQAEIQQLKDHMASLVQANVKMFEELQLYKNAEGSEQKINKLVESLEAQHHQLLQTQLATLKKEILQQHSGLTVNGQTGPLHLRLPVESDTDAEASAMGISFLSEEQAPGEEGPGLTGIEIVEVQLHTEQAKTAASATTTDPICPVKVLQEQQGATLPEKRACEEVPEGGNRNKVQRTT
ncbi:hypothetical protein Z043_122671, partial [Scleropages formosus]